MLSVETIKEKTKDVDMQQIVGYEGLARAYGQLGFQLLVVLVAIRSLLRFLGLLVVVLAVAKGAAGLIRRMPSRLATSSWTSLMALTLLLITYGVDLLWTSLLSDGILDYKGDLSAVQEARPLIVSLVSMCEGDMSIVPLAEMLAPLNATLSTLPIGIEDIDMGMLQAKEAHELIGFLEDNIDSLRAWAANESSDLVPLLLGTTGLGRQEFSTLIGHGGNILQVVLSLIRCDTIRPFAADLLKSVSQKCLPVSQGSNFITLSLCVTIAVWSALASRAAYPLERPRKIWYDHVSGRWFRFRYSFKIAKKLRKESTGERPSNLRVTRHRFSKAHIADTIFVVNTVWQIFLAVAACMILATPHDINPSAPLVIAGSVLLILSTFFSMAGSWTKVAGARFVGLRFFGLLLCAVSMTLFILSGVDNFTRSADCFSMTQYNPSYTGPVMTSTVSLVCPPHNGANVGDSSNCSVNLTGQGLRSGDRLLALPGKSSCKNIRNVQSAYMSEEAEMFGRLYTFANGSRIPAGRYTLCWSSAKRGGKIAADFSKFAGHMYVEQDVDRFSTCAIDTISGFVYVGCIVLIISVFQCIRLLVGFLSLFPCIYREHLTDRMRKEGRDLIRITSGQAVGNLARTSRTACVRRFWCQLALVCILIIGLTIPVVILVQPSMLIDWQWWTRDRNREMMESGAMLRLPCPGCCNLLESNCGKRVDEVAFATVHNAMSFSMGGWVLPNNLYSLNMSLYAGVRGLMIDLHYNWPEDANETERERPSQIHMCHSFCGLGWSLFSEALSTIKAFLDSYPSEIIVLMLEQYVATDTVIREIEEVGLGSYVAYSHPNSSTPWPTLQALIAADTRLLVFSNKKPRFRGYYYNTSAGKRNVISKTNMPADHETKIMVPWWHYLWDFMTETPFTYSAGDITAMEQDTSFLRGNVSLANLSQKAPIGNQAYRLTILNHFVSIPFPRAAYAERANSVASLGKRTELCRETWNHQVNFPTIDFWSVGDIVDVSLRLSNSSI
eukprot:TRINITY_DN24595_c0_g1_i1.p1 TRINITY_DN24595_c0_g1~~TRINITY_DN24595_c0_g1_i1.p1  ORF type:complete len:1135 (+),score=77.11 TRINITY_DN24595_c0_g1_i1:380-3406(+)